MSVSNLAVDVAMNAILRGLAWQEFVFILRRSTLGPVA